MRLALLFFLALALSAGAETRYYLVEGIMKLPEGRRVGVAVSIVKRTVDREAGRIEEAVISLRGQDPAREFVTVITPSAGKAVVSSPQGGVSGEATLSGPEWAWTGMSFTTRVEAGGMRVEGEDQFSADTITARKKVFDANGKPQIVIEESGKSISEAVYQVLRSRLLAK